MTSKHYRWQTRWRVDLGAAQATHDSGLVVTLARAPPGSRAAYAGHSTPENVATVLHQLLAENGPHNAPKMLARLMREAGDVYREAMHD